MSSVSCLPNGSLRHRSMFGQLTPNYFRARRLNLVFFTVHNFSISSSHARTSQQQEAVLLVAAATTRRHSQPRHVSRPMRASLHCVITFLHVRHFNINAYRLPRTIASLISLTIRYLHLAYASTGLTVSVFCTKGARCDPRFRSYNSIPIHLVLVAMAT